MAALIVIAVIVLLIVALCLIPITVELFYASGHFKAKFKILGISPSKRKKSKKPKKDADVSENAAKPKKRSIADSIKKLGFTLDEWIEVLQAALRALRHIGKSTTMPILKLHLVVSSDEPYKTALNYNRALSAAYMISPYLEKAFDIKERDIDITLDFDLGKNVIDFYTKLRLRVGSLLYAALAALISIIVLIVKRRITIMHERKTENGEQTQRIDAVDNEQH